MKVRLKLKLKSIDRTGAKHKLCGFFIVTNSRFKIIPKYLSFFVPFCSLIYDLNETNDKTRLSQVQHCPRCLDPLDISYSIFNWILSIWKSGIEFSYRKQITAHMMLFRVSHISLQYHPGFPRSFKVMSKSGGTTCNEVFASVLQTSIRGKNVFRSILRRWYSCWLTVLILTRIYSLMLVNATNESNSWSRTRSAARRILSRQA